MPLNLPAILRCFQAVIAAIVLGTIAAAAPQYTGPGCDSPPAEVIFLLSTSGFALVVLFSELLLPFVIRVFNALDPSLLPILTQHFLVAFFHGLTAACWTGGFVAFLVFLSRQVKYGFGCNVATCGMVLSGVDAILFTISAVRAVQILAAARLVQKSAQEEARHESESRRSSVSYAEIKA